jgi:hypothetical protein
MAKTGMLCSPKAKWRQSVEFGWLDRLKALTEEEAARRVGNANFAYLYVNSLKESRNEDWLASNYLRLVLAFSDDVPNSQEWRESLFRGVAANLSPTHRQICSEVDAALEVTSSAAARLNEKALREFYPRAEAMDSKATQMNALVRATAQVGLPILTFALLWKYTSLLWAANGSGVVALLTVSIPRQSRGL